MGLLSPGIDGVQTTMKNNLLIRGGLTTLALSAFMAVHAQDTFSLSNIPSPPRTAAAATFATSTTLGPAASTYVLGSAMTINSASVTVLSATSFGSYHRLELYNSAFPTLTYTTGQLFPAGIGTAAGLTNTTYTMAAGGGSLVGSTITAGSTWSYNTITTTLGGGPVDATISINFTTRALAPVGETMVVSGDSVDLQGDPSNTVLTFPVTAPSYVFGSQIRRVGTGSVSLLNAASSSADVAVAFRNSAYPWLRQGLITSAAGAVVGTPFAYTSNFYSITNNLTGDWTGTQTLVGCTIPTGSVWTAEIYEAVNHGDDVPEASISNFTVQFTNEGPANATAAAPSVNFDLGDIDVTSASLAIPYISTQTGLAAGEVRWFKFNVSDITPFSGKFLDIYSEGIETTVADDFDTEFVLYKADGTMMIKDGDDGQGFGSAISIGDSLSPRPASPATDVLTVGLANNGRDLIGLGAGTYYLGVYGFATTLNRTGHGFDIPLLSRGLSPASWTLRLQTNGDVASKSISGNLVLQDTGDDGAAGTESIAWTLSDGSNTYNGTVDVDDFGGGAYSITIPSAAPNGDYTLRFKGGTFLASTYNLTLAGANLTQNASLRNGDIDQDSEVGPGDFEAVVAQFGFPGDADVDNDAEVGPSDFEIIVGNFGLGDE